MVRMKRKGSVVGGAAFEFLVVSPALNQGGQGGLLSVTKRRDGTVEVEVYRADQEVYVRVGNRRYRAAKGGA